jgi:hypothetical protein
MPGLGVYYSESSDGVPAVMKHVLGNMPALYSSMVFLTVRFVAVPTVTDEERFLAWRCAVAGSTERTVWHSWLPADLYAVSVTGANGRGPWVQSLAQSQQNQDALVHDDQNTTCSNLA